MRLIRLAPLLSIALLLAACGGGGKSSSDTLSKADYKAKLQQIAKEANTAQGNLAQGFQLGSVPELKKRLQKFVADSRRIGDEVAAIKAPKDATAANAELASGEHDTASALDALIPGVDKYKNSHDALLYLQRRLRSNTAGRELQGALTKLRALGYIQSSTQ